MSKDEVKNEVLDDSAYDDVAGAGYDEMGGDKFTIPMLLCAQSTSEVARDKVNGIEAGCYYNSVTKENYGKEITVVIAHFEPTWQVWKPNLGGFVARVRPNSIKVKGDVYKGMTTPEGNDVIDTWMYFVLIKGQEDRGMLMMPITSNAIKYAKILNGMTHDSRMTSGKRAPLFYNYWTLGSGRTKFEKGDSYSFGEGSTPLIKCAGMVPPAIYLSCVKDAIAIAPAAVYGTATLALDEPQPQLAIAEDSSDASGKY